MSVNNQLCTLKLWKPLYIDVLDLSATKGFQKQQIDKNSLKCFEKNQLDA